jgi:hypothetical protein
MNRRVMLGRAMVGMLAGIAVGALISEATFFFLRNGEERTPAVIELIIPMGTASRVDAGQAEPSLPDSMTFVVGDTLLVRNRDSVSHELGPLFIPAGASASLMLATAQKYAAACSFEPTRYFGIDVQPALTLQTRVVGILQAGIPLGFLFILYGVFAVPSGKARES